MLMRKPTIDTSPFSNFKSIVKEVYESVSGKKILRFTDEPLNEELFAFPLLAVIIQEGTTNVERVGVKTDKIVKQIDIYFIYKPDRHSMKIKELEDLLDAVQVELYKRLHAHDRPYSDFSITSRMTNIDDTKANSILFETKLTTMVTEYVTIGSCNA